MMKTEKFASFIMPDSDVYAVVLKLRRNSADIRLTIMIGKQYFGFDSFRRIDELTGCHRVRLVARHEGDVDVLDVLHLRDVLCIACDVDTQPVDGQDLTVVAPFRVKLCASL